jgi:hypothetical protein
VKARVVLGLGMLGFLVGVPAIAHHSFAAEFDASKAIRLTGALTKIEWTNPHSYFYIELVPSPLSFGANGLFFTKYLSIVSVFRWWLSEFRSWSNLNGRFPHPFPWLWTHLSHRPIRTLFLFVTCPA